MRQLEKPEAGPETGNGLDPLCRESPGAGAQPSHTHSLTSTYPCLTCTYTETHTHAHTYFHRAAHTDRHIYSHTGLCTR